ncbi:hypothetical protein BD779DRAFT_958840 [Infundibulicybe gibba]|nr:hypothetical protein BD779DRAFT_958840 [Infundibulicybe gibba]
MAPNPRYGGSTKAAILPRATQFPAASDGFHPAIIIVLAVFGFSACMATIITLIWRRNHHPAPQANIDTRSVHNDKIVSTVVNEIPHLPPAHLESTHSIVRSSFSSSKIHLDAPVPAFAHRSAPSDVPASPHSSYAWDSVYQEQKLLGSSSYPAEDLLNTLADRFYWETDGAISRTHSRTSPSVLSSQRSSLGYPRD